MLEYCSGWMRASYRISSLNSIVSEIRSRGNGRDQGKDLPYPVADAADVALIQQKCFHRNLFTPQLRTQPLLRKHIFINHWIWPVLREWRHISNIVRSAIYESNPRESPEVNKGSFAFWLVCGLDMEFPVLWWPFWIFLLARLVVEGFFVSKFEPAGHAEMHEEVGWGRHFHPG